MLNICNARKFKCDVESVLPGTCTNGCRKGCCLNILSLNLVIINSPFVESVKHLAPLGKSDHVVMDIVCNFNINVTGVKHKLNFSKGKYDDLRKSCNIDWSNILYPAINSVDEMWETV